MRPIVVHGILTKQEVDEVLCSLNGRQWDAGHVRAPEYTDVKRNQELRGSDPVLKNILENLRAKVMHNQEVCSRAFPYKATSMRFNRYADGGEYRWHADSAIMNVPPIRSDLSCTLFLSNDFQGGELEIQEIDGTSLHLMLPGSAVIYPSTSVHRVLPVTAGERIFAVMWMQTFIRDEEKRDQLTRMYRLAEATKGHDRHTEIVSLYNNLLRMWSEF